jgi:predicted dehydrogenase
MSGADARHGIARREFLAGAVTMTAAAALGLGAAEAQAPKLRLGIIGCGGRGGWIGGLFEENSNTEVVALHDYFEDRVADLRTRFGVAQDRCFTGLDGYKRLLDTDVDAVAIESPPYFHPAQAAAAVDAGKHVFLAKPVAVDVPGCLSIGESARKAQGKQSFLVDFQTRNNAAFREMARRVHAGEIGEPVLGQVYYHTGRLGGRAEPGTQEARLRNWVFDIALSGDIIVEQNIHVLDVASWLLDAAPTEAVGTGGRRVRTDVGDCWDHFAVIYKFPGDVIIDFSSSQFVTGFHDMCIRLFGSRGTAESHYGGAVWIDNGQRWDGGDTGPIYTEGAINNIKDFSAGIASGQLVNTGEEAVRSNLIAVLGRQAAYRGGTVTCDEMMATAEETKCDLSGLTR